MINEEDVKDLISLTKDIEKSAEISDIDAIKECAKYILEILEQPKITIKRMF